MKNKFKIKTYKFKICLHFHVFNLKTIACFVFWKQHLIWVQRFKNNNEKSNLNYHPRLAKKHKTNKNNNSKNSPDKPCNNKQT